MSALRERPRAAIAVGVLLLVVVVAAVLVGSALGGGGGGAEPAGQGQARNRAVREELTQATQKLRRQEAAAAAAAAATDRWRERAQAAEKQLTDLKEEGAADDRKHQPKQRHGRTNPHPGHHSHRNSAGSRRKNG